MLQLEMLESRRLLAVTVADSLNAADDLLLDFPTQAINELTLPESVTITNQGEVDLTVTDWTLATDSDFELLNFNAAGDGSDDIVLGANEQLKIWVRFGPKDFTAEGLQGTLTDTLTVNFSIRQWQQNVTLTGQASGADLQLQDIDVEMGTAGEFELVSFVENQGGTPWDFTVRYLGAAITDIVGMAFKDSGQSGIVRTSAVPDTLLTFETLEFTVSVFGTTAQNPADVLVITTSSGSLEYPTEIMGILDDVIDLGDVPVGQTGEATFTLANQGDGDLYVFSLSNSESTLVLTQQQQLNRRISPGGTLDITAAFTPTGAGTVTDTIVVDSNDYLDEHTISFTAVGLEPMLTVHETLGLEDDSTLPFGPRPVSRPLATDVTITNDGNDTLTITSWTNTLPAAFSATSEDFIEACR